MEIGIFNLLCPQSNNGTQTNAQGTRVPSNHPIKFNMYLKVPNFNYDVLNIGKDAGNLNNLIMCNE